MDYKIQAYSIFQTTKLHETFITSIIDACNNTITNLIPINSKKQGAKTSAKMTALSPSKSTQYKSKRQCRDQNNNNEGYKWVKIDFFRFILFKRGFILFCIKTN